MAASRAKKSLGQHFLINPRIPEAICRLLNAGPGDQIIEIGPGPGALTKFLAHSCPRTLLLIEKDRDWAARCGSVFPGQTLLADALAFSWARLDRLGRWKITGNLPYNIASPLIWDILSKCRAWDNCVFMTQKEVGLRLCARPGSKSYGALSVWTRLHSEPRLEFSVAPGSFQPMPKVDSAVISFTPKTAADLPASPQKLKKLLDLCFQNRRKQLGGIFRRSSYVSLEEGLKELAIPPDSRPEALSPEQFLKLSEYFPSRSRK